MSKLLFCARWSENRQKTWSGTTAALSNALSQHYIVSEIDMGNHLSTLEKLRASMESRMGIYDLDDRLVEANSRWFWKTNVLSGGSKVFQFDESPFPSAYTCHYIYQDMSALWLLDYFYRDERIRQYFCPTCSRAGVSRRASHQEAAYSKASAIFTMGQWLKNYLVSKGYKGKVFHVGGGAGFLPKDFDPTLRTGNKLLFVGRDFRRKGGDQVVAAFRLLKRGFPSLELYIAGGIDQRQIGNFSGSEDIHCMGDLNPIQLAHLFEACDVFVMPSRFEPYGLVFNEAALFGLPCIGRNDFEMPYLIDEGNTGFLVRSDDPSELAELMKRALSEKDVASNAWDYRRTALQERTWEAVASRIVSVIDS